jgi:hypothetical protein
MPLRGRVWLRLLICLHVLGTLLGLLWVASSLLFPAVHAIPGLIGHRLFERNEAIGDLRVSRKDYSLWWFIRANHQMTLQMLTKGIYWR